MGITPGGGGSVAGGAASDAPETGNPVQIGGSVDNTSPAAAGEGDVRRFRASPSGNMLVGIGSDSPINGDGQSAPHRVVDQTDLARTLGVSCFAFAPDGLYDRLRSLGDAVGAGRGVLAAAPWIPGASDIQVIRGNVTSTTRVTLGTPAAGKKFRVVSVYVVANSATAVFVEIYFGTGASIGTTQGKAIYEFHADRAAGNSDNGNIVFPDGGGLVGAVDEVLSIRLTVTSDAILAVSIREE